MEDGLSRSALTSRRQALRYFLVAGAEHEPGTRGYDLLVPTRTHYLEIAESIGLPAEMVDTWRTSVKQMNRLLAAITLQPKQLPPLPDGGNDFGYVVQVIQEMRSVIEFRNLDHDDEDLEEHEYEDDALDWLTDQVVTLTGMALPNAETSGSISEPDELGWLAIEFAIEDSTSPFNASIVLTGTNADEMARDALRALKALLGQ